jgi:hypothetical protein
MNTEKIHKILQYALLCASQQDDWKDQSVGDIHLIKYVYLADLAYSKGNEGKTFTGVDWKFHHFGPWSFVTYKEIPLALDSIGAHEEILQSDYEDGTYHRWSIRESESLLQKVSLDLPLVITAAIARFVCRFGNDTSSLLHYVYNTRPMKNAAPGEILDFSLAADILPAAGHARKFESSFDQLSARKKKKFTARIKALKEIRESRTHMEKLVSPPVPPMSKEVYLKGMEYLNSLAGPLPPEGRFDVEFDSSLWDSSIRKSEGY